MPIEGKTRREVLTEFRHAEILAAARKVFAEKGFREATLDQIAAEAGIAKGTLYLYFENKEEIFWGAVRERLLELQERLKEVVARPGTARERLREVLRVRFEMMRRDEQFKRVYFAEFGQLCGYSGPHAAEFRELQVNAARLLAPVLSEGIASGELRDVPPLETAMALTDLVRGTSALSMLGLHENNVDLEQFIFDLFWRGVRKGEAQS